MRFVYPNGKRKALTFSYDDAQRFDRELVEIFNKYGVKGTFHLNSGTLSDTHDGTEFFISKEEVPTLYKGHEVAVHGVEHRNLPNLSKSQMVMEIEEDRKALEKLTGSFVQGMSYAFGSYNDQVVEVLKVLGIKYSRTVKATNGFFPPEDFLTWHPTCHHDGNLMELGKRFLNTPDYIELPLMYVWGHSFEFGNKNDYSVIDAFCEMMSGKEDIWYATNLEICDYINATRNQEFSADGMTMKNPTATSVWINTKEGIVEVKPGQVISL